MGLISFTIQVIDTQPIPGLVISPKEGVVPVGGTAELKVCSLNVLELYEVGKNEIS